jgi:hypothetical protein
MWRILVLVALIACLVYVVGCSSGSGLNLGGITDPGTTPDDGTGVVPPPPPDTGPSDGFPPPPPVIDPTPGEDGPPEPPVFPPAPPA